MGDIADAARAESALTEDRQWTIDALCGQLGWHGTARQFQVRGMTARVARAIEQRARALGMTDFDNAGIDDRNLATESNPAVPCAITVGTGNPEKHLAADKLIAYIDGLSDVLTDEYGRREETVEVTRADLKALVSGALSGAGAFSPSVADAVNRAQRALDGPGRT